MVCSTTAPSTMGATFSISLATLKRMLGTRSLLTPKDNQAEARGSARPGENRETGAGLVRS